MKVGDLVQFARPYRESEKGIFLVVEVESDTWVRLHKGPESDNQPGSQTLHIHTALKVIK